MFQNLSYRIDDTQKLKLIFENTKISYKRRLALTPIRTLRQLTEYCYNFDSLEPNLYVPINQKPHPINQIDYSELDEEENEFDDDEEVNALFKDRKFKNKKPFKKENTNNSLEENRENTIRRSTCWNCRKTGHWYPDCPEPRTTFCYVCGEPNCTLKNCPNNHTVHPSSPKN